MVTRTLQMTSFHSVIGANFRILVHALETIATIFIILQILHLNQKIDDPNFESLSCVSQFVQSLEFRYDAQSFYDDFKLLCDSYTSDLIILN